MTHVVRTNVPFVDSTRGARNLQTLVDACITSGSRADVAEFVGAIESHLRASPDPDMALNNLVRFSEASLSKASLFNDLLAYPVLLDVLVKLSGFSQYFADILVRDPELFRWLTASDSLLMPRSSETFIAETRRILETFQKPERRLDGLRRLYRREIVRIGARDILGEADLATVTEELSFLADAQIDAACETAKQQLSEQFPVPPNTPYAIIGLGKLGGCELNYSSDIDLLFVYREEGELENARGKLGTYHEYFNKLCEKAVQNLSLSTREGHLYRVDMRLRPESGAGPLARSLSSYLRYYESRGELWERQMLIKSRAVAGNVELGNQFINQIQPFVYPRTLLQHPAESIARIKARIEATIEGEENVKLRAGGIRDIEFAVQALQLINGGRIRSVRHRNTILAIEALREENLLTASEAATLTDAYVFLRTLEHRLQIMMNSQTHALPEDKGDRAILAKRVGLGSPAALVEAYTGHHKGVRAIFNQVLNASPGHEADITLILEGGIGEERIKSVLATHGFQDVGRAMRNLASLTRGSSLTANVTFDARSREALREIARVLFDEIEKTPSPDLTLNGITLLAASERTPDMFYRQLREQGFRNLVVKLCSVAPRFVKTLASRPGLLEQLTSSMDEPSAPPRHASLGRREIIEYKNFHELHAGIRHVLGLTTFAEFTYELSMIADTLLAHVLRRETKALTSGAVPLSIFALGKYGTREMGLDADLDLVFLVDTKSQSVKHKAEKLAQKVVASLSQSTERGRGYDIDARLRPEGKSAPLVVEATAFHVYLKERASLWERQSMTRLRFVCGNKRFSDKELQNILSLVYSSPLPENWVEDIVDMRKKMETRSRIRAGDFHDIKLGAGGMVDVEFAVQMCMLALGTSGEKFQGRPTLEVLEAIPSSMISPAAKENLGAAYTLFRGMELVKRTMLEEHGSMLPEGASLDILAKAINGTTGTQFKQNILSTMQSVRQHFLEIAKVLHRPE